MNPTCTRLYPAIASLLFCAACSQPPHSVVENYYLIAPNAKSPYWEQVAAGLYAAAKELHVNAKLAGPPAYDPEAQKQEFRKIAASKPAAILLSVSDPKVMTEEINNAIAAGIPVITIDSDAEQSNRLFFVGTNNYQSGQMGGRLLAEKLNHKGNVAAILTVGQPNLEER